MSLRPGDLNEDLDVTIGIVETEEPFGPTVQVKYWYVCPTGEIDSVLGYERKELLSTILV